MHPSVSTGPIMTVRLPASQRLPILTNSPYLNRSLCSRTGDRLLGPDRVPYVPSVSLSCVVYLRIIYLNIDCRLAFVTLKDNLMVLSLRAMIVKFVVLMLIAVFCFCGFLYALWTCVCLLRTGSSLLKGFPSQAESEPSWVSSSLALIGTETELTAS